MMTEAEIIKACAEIAGRVVKPEGLCAVQIDDDGRVDHATYYGDRASDELLADYRAGRIRNVETILAAGVVNRGDEDPLDVLDRFLDRNQKMREAGIDRTTRWLDYE